MWKAGLSVAANVTAFGWNQAEVTEALDAVDAFLTARAAYEADDSTKNRMAKDEAKAAMRDFANTSIRFNRLMRDEHNKWLEFCRRQNSQAVRQRRTAVIP
jgi:hypothetical protein